MNDEKQKKEERDRRNFGFTMDEFCLQFTGMTQQEALEYIRQEWDKEQKDKLTEEKK